MRQFIREMPGKNRCDLTHLLGDGEAFRRLVAALAEPFHNSRVTSVAAIDAMGFALGGAVANALNSGIVLVRKPGKVAWKCEGVTFSDYTGNRKRLEIAADAMRLGDRVLVVDDWSETGAQLRATITLLEKLGGVVVGASLLNIDPRVRADPALAGYRLEAVVQYSVPK